MQQYAYLSDLFQLNEKVNYKAWIIMQNEKKIQKPIMNLKGDIFISRLKPQTLLFTHYKLVCVHFMRWCQKEGHDKSSKEQLTLAGFYFIQIRKEKVSIN